MWGVGAGEAAPPFRRPPPPGRLPGEGKPRSHGATLRPGRKGLARRARREFPREDQGWGRPPSAAARPSTPEPGGPRRALPMPPLSGSLSGEISGSGTFTRPAGRVSLTGRRIEVAGKYFGDAELRAQVPRGRSKSTRSRRVQGGTASPRRVSGSPRPPSPPPIAAHSSTASRALSRSAPPTSPGLAALAGIPPELVGRIPAAHQADGGGYRGASERSR